MHSKHNDRKKVTVVTSHEQGEEMRTCKPVSLDMLNSMWVPCQGKQSPVVVREAESKEGDTVVNGRISYH